MAEKQEIWRKIDDYPNYEVSSEGRVRNVKTGRILRPGKISSGYLAVVLWKNKKHKTIPIHRLVATAFIPNSENNPCVNHIDGCKTDNRVENLEWVTYSENMKHAFRTGLQVHSGGAGRPKQKVRCIETDQVFESLSLAGRYFGCSREAVRNSIHKGHKVKGKYHFELA